MFYFFFLLINGVFAGRWAGNVAPKSCTATVAAEEHASVARARGNVTPLDALRSLGLAPLLAARPGVDRGVLRPCEEVRVEIRADILGSCGLLQHGAPFVGDEANAVRLANAFGFALVKLRGVLSNVLTRVLRTPGEITLRDVLVFNELPRVHRFETLSKGGARHRFLVGRVVAAESEAVAGLHTRFGARFARRGSPFRSEIALSVVFAPDRAVIVLLAHLLAGLVVRNFGLRD